MSSTPAVDTPVSLASSPSYNAPSPSPYISSSPALGANTVTSVTLVTTSPTSFISVPVTTSALSKQSQQSFSASQTPMSVTTVATTAATTSASLSVPSSAVPSTSANASSASSASSATTASSSDDRSTTSAPKSSVQPTTPPTTTASTTIQSSSLASSPLTTSKLSVTASPTSISIATSNTPFTTTSSPLSSASAPQNPSDIPLTTVLESTTIFLTSTNSQGQVVTSVPPVVTEVITTTGSGGIATTVTQAIVNPTLASNDTTTGGSSFFADTGAVVGVFVVAGLATASIMMWILFAIRRRQRMRRFEQDSVIEAAVAAAGFNRAPLDDDDEGDSPASPHAQRQFSSGMDQRASLLGSLLTSARLSDVPDDPARDGANSHPGRSVEHRTSSHPEGYAPARTMSPLPRAGQCDEIGSSRDRKSSYGHTPTYSAGSFEPLLANYAQNMADQDTSAVEPPPNHSSQPPGGGLGTSRYSSDGSPEDALRPSLKRQSSSDSSVLRDDDVYAHYVLMVRNVPDDQSQHSA